MENPFAPKERLPMRREGFAACILNEKLYVLGGGHANGRLSSSDIVFEPELNAWSDIAPAPIRGRLPAAVALNGGIHLMGGFRLRHLASHARYEPATDTWSSRAPIPNPRAESVAVGRSGGLLLFGGVNSDGVLDSNHVYDSTNDSWSSRRPMIRGLRGALAHELGGMIYVIGGSDSVGYGRGNYVYDVAKDIWERRASLPMDMENAAIFRDGEKIYLTNEFAVLEYETTLDTWVRRPADQWAEPTGPLLGEMPALDFGIVPWDAPTTRSLRVANRGEALLRLYNIFMKGDVEFSPADGGWASAGLGVGALDHGDLRIRFDPGTSRDVREYRAILGFDANDPSYSGDIVHLMAILGIPVMECETALDFGKTPPESRVGRAFTIKNNGNSSLIIKAVQVPEPSFAASTNLPLNIPPSEERILLMEYRASTVPANGNAKIINNDPHRPEFELSLTGAPALPLLMSEPQVEFGMVDVAEIAVKNLELHNEGDGSLRIHAVHFRSEGFQSAALMALPLDIAPGESYMMEIRYLPRTEVRESEIVLTTNEPGRETVPITLRGEPGYPRLDPQDIELDFGLVGAGLDKELPFKIINSGGGALVVSEIIPAEDTKEFIVEFSPELPFILAPGAEIEFKIKYAPAELVGAGQLIIRSNDVQRPELHIALTGERGDPEMEIEPTELDFGTLSPDIVVEKTFRVKNSGEGLLRVSGFESDSPQVTAAVAGEPSPPLPVDVAPAGEIEVTVSLRPTLDFNAANIRIRGNDVGTVENMVPIAAEVGRMEITITPERLDFGMVPYNRPKSMTFIIRNSGDAPVNITAIALTGSGVFSRNTYGQPPFELLPGVESTQSILLRSPDPMRSSPPASGQVVVSSTAGDKVVSLAGRPAPRIYF